MYHAFTEIKHMLAILLKGVYNLLKTTMFESFSIFDEKLYEQCDGFSFKDLHLYKHQPLKQQICNITLPQAHI